MVDVIELKSVDDFVNNVEKSEKLAVVDFYATWCGPCKMQAPIIDKIAGEQNEKVSVFKVDVDELTDIAVKYNITSIPTVMLFKNGNVVERWVGLTPEHILKQAIDNHLEESSKNK